MQRRSLIAIAAFAALSIVAGYPAVLVAVAQADVEGIDGNDSAPNHPFMRSAQSDVVRVSARDRRDGVRRLISAGPALLPTIGIALFEVVLPAPAPAARAGFVARSCIPAASPRGPPVA